MLTLLQPNFVLWHTIIIVVLWNDQIAVLKVKVTAKFRTSFIEYLQVWKNLVVSMFLHRKPVDVLQDYAFWILVPLSQSLLLHSSLCLWQEEEKWSPVEQYWKEVRYRAVIVVVCCWLITIKVASSLSHLWLLCSLEPVAKIPACYANGAVELCALGVISSCEVDPHGSWGTD